MRQALTGRGSYVLLIELPGERKIAVGKLGVITFPESFYAYVGSAMGGFKPRIAHHLGGKSPHWHIDYLLREAMVLEIVLCDTEERVECTIARGMGGRFRSIPYFGSSDCRCGSHLYIENDKDRLREGIVETVAQVSLAYRVISL